MKVIGAGIAAIGIIMLAATLRSARLAAVNSTGRTLEALKKMAISLAAGDALNAALDKSGEFAGMCAIMQDDPAISPAQAWAAYNAAQNIQVPQKIIDILDKLFADMGQTPYHMQSLSLESAYQSAELEYRRLSEKYDKEGKLYSSLGCLCALAVFIILI